MSAPAIRLDDATVLRDGRSVLEGISFEVQPGEAMALIGPNGAGKSTLLDGLLGLAEVRARGFEVAGAASGRAARGRVGLLPQSSVHDPDFPVTLAQVVGMGRITGRRIGWPTRADRAAVAAAIADVGLTGLERRRFGELSGGQRQRGLLARALVQDPAVLLLDEPFNGLDQDRRARLLAIIRALKARGVALVITTHDLDLAREACESTLVIDGRQYAFGPTDAVLTLETIQAAFEGEAVEVDGHTLATHHHHHEDDE